MIDQPWKENVKALFGKSIQEKKDYIARIAGDVFFTKGYKESSLQDISIKGKISKAGIYHYYKTKEDILSYLLLKNTDHGVNALKQCLETAAGAGLDPRQSFEALIKTYAAYLLKNRKISLLVLRERHQLSGANRKILREQERVIFRLLRDQLKMVPELQEKININLISFQIMSMIHWMGYWFDEKGPLSTTEAIDQTIYVIFNGILKPDR